MGKHRFLIPPCSEPREDVSNSLLQLLRLHLDEFTHFGFPLIWFPHNRIIQFVGGLVEAWRNPVQELRPNHLAEDDCDDANDNEQPDDDKLFLHEGVVKGS